MSLRFLTFALVAALALLCAHPAVRHKISLYCFAIHYELVCTDLLPRTPPPPAPVTNPATRTRRVIAIRHAQSVWNTMANATLPLGERAVNVAASIAGELAVLLNERDSVFYDASLTPHGVEQSRELGKHVPALLAWAAAGGATSQKKAKPNIKLVVSNQRRSIETAAVAFESLLNEKKKLHVDSALQEACSKIDAHSFQFHAGELTRVQLAVSDDTWASVAPTHNLEGAKTLATNVWRRHDIFMQRLFSSAYDNDNSDGGDTGDSVVVLVGHSAWLRRFFLRYARAGSDGDNDVATKSPSAALLKQAGVRKFENCAAAGFTVRLDAATNAPYIDDIELLHGALTG